jgi:hypothetical protein
MLCLARTINFKKNASEERAFTTVHNIISVVIYKSKLYNSLNLKITVKLYSLSVSEWIWISSLIKWI